MDDESSVRNSVLGYRSPSDGVYFVNIRFMFNADRLASVKSYHLKDASRQQELPLAEVTTLPAPPRFRISPQRM